MSFLDQAVVAQVGLIGRVGEQPGDRDDPDAHEQDAAEHRREPDAAQRAAPERRSRRARRRLRGQEAHQATASSANQRPPSSQRAAVVSPAGRATRVERVDGDPRPREPARGAGVVLQAQRAGAHAAHRAPRTRRAPRRPASGGRRAAAAAPRGRRRCRCCRRAAAPSAIRPWPGTTSKTEPLQHVRPAVARHAHSGGGRVDPERGDAAAGERADVAPGAAADVEHRPAGAAQDAQVRAPGAGQPARRGELARRTPARSRATRPSGRRVSAAAYSRSASGVMRPRRASRAKRPRGRRRCDGAGVGDVVDVAQRRELADAQPVGEQPLALQGARVVRAHRHAVQQLGARLAQAQRPVAAVRRGAQDGVDAAARRAARRPARAARA